MSVYTTSLLSICIRIYIYISKCNIIIYSNILDILGSCAVHLHKARFSKKGRHHLRLFLVAWGWATQTHAPSRLICPGIPSSDTKLLGPLPLKYLFPRPTARRRLRHAWLCIAPGSWSILDISWCCLLPDWSLISWWQGYLVTMIPLGWFVNDLSNNSPIKSPLFTPSPFARKIQQSQNDCAASRQLVLQGIIPLLQPVAREVQPGHFSDCPPQQVSLKAAKPAHRNPSAQVSLPMTTLQKGTTGLYRCPTHRQQSWFVLPRYCLSLFLAVAVYACMHSRVYD